MASVLASAFLVTGAHATTTDWGAHAPLEVAATITPVGPFEDVYFFTLPAGNTLSSTAVSNNLSNVLGITGGEVSLYETSGSSSSLLGGYAFYASSGDVSYSFGALAGGSYFYEVTGTGTGTNGGFYSLSSAITPVPEPEVLTLMLAGLGMVGFMTHRRRQ
jgi:hypothetical protein